jgi:hypothetical protein
MRRHRQDAAPEGHGLLSVRASEYEKLGALEALRCTCLTPFDPERSDHTRALKELWSAAFPSESFELPAARWKDLGFQGTGASLALDPSPLGCPLAACTLLAVPLQTEGR